jgi:hypothetical protein
MEIETLSQSSSLGLHSQPLLRNDNWVFPYSAS